MATTAGLVERYRRLNEKTLHYTVMIDDPKAYTRPCVGRTRSG